MSAQAEFIEQLAPIQRRPTPLSQAVVSGIVVVTDALAVLGAAAIVHFACVLFFGHSKLPPPAVALLATAVLVLSINAAGLYRFNSVMQPGRVAKTAVALLCLVALVLIALGVTLKLAGEFSRGGVAAWVGLTMLLLVGLRFAVAASLRSLARAGRIGRKIVVYGSGPQAARLIRRINDLNEPWNRVVGVFDDRGSRAAPVVEGHPVIGGVADLVRWSQAHRPDEVLIALPWSAEDRIIQVLNQLAVMPANVRLAPEFQRLDLILGRTNSQFGLPMLSAFEKPVEGWGRIWKRAFDLMLSAMVVVAAAPLLLLIAVLVKLGSPGPVLFSQPRFGFNQKLINVYKFRTMRQDASDTMGTRLTERDDERVTRIGALLRRTSLDEMPQLLNVLRGEMSLVGPRPHAIRTTAGGKQCDAVVDQYAVRHKVKPGITGWAQVNGWRGTMETEEHLVKRLEHDLYYINNWSPLFDVKILAMTAWAVINGRNSF